MKILFLIRTLFVGGAERQLVALARGLHERGEDVIVAAFYGGGPFEQELAAAGIPVHTLRKAGRWDFGAFGFRLLRLLRREKPDILHSYMVGPNIAAAVVRPLFPRMKVVWGVRDALRELSQFDWFIRSTVHVQRFASPLPDLIIVNSRAGQDQLGHSGFPRRSIVAIPNGIDTERFKPDPAARKRVRAELGIRDDQLAVGLVGRIDPAKGHLDFLGAAALLVKEREGEDLRFVCAGGGDEVYAERLLAETRRLGLDGRVTWLGSRDDVPAVLNGFDLYVSASNTEAFSNSIAEAMASGVPCVVTDVGDSAWIVSDTGVVVSPDDPSGLAGGIRQLIGRLQREGTGLPEQVRRRIVEHFNYGLLIERTARELTGLLRA
jgi:glycosyltransferase involved in cell wall biosynthesis